MLDRISFVLYPSRTICLMVELSQCYKCFFGAYSILENDTFLTGSPQLPASAIVGIVVAVVAVLVAFVVISVIIYVKHKRPQQSPDLAHTLLQKD